MAEWSKAAGCKPVSLSRVGSNPTFLNIKKFDKNNLCLFKNLKLKGIQLRNKLRLGRKINYLFLKKKIQDRNYSNIILEFSKINSSRKMDKKNGQEKFLLLNQKLYTNIFYKKYKPTTVRTYLSCLIFKSNTGVNTRIPSYKYITHHKYSKVDQILNLNFKRSKFFPSIRSSKTNKIFLTLSLGLF